MKLFICVDDTDDLTKSTSTGKISDLIAQAVVDMGGTLVKGVTRHQLLLDEDIDYTSHNSSMCMELDVNDPNITIDLIREKSEEVLMSNVAESADPGLCFCIADELKEPDKLMAYGRRAQKEIISKQEAFDLADEIGGTILKEYGGTGIGVIGALAGVGLRLSGCDGTFRGGKDSKFANQGKFVSEWKDLTGVEQILDFDGNHLKDTDIVIMNDQMKFTHLDHMKTMMVKVKDGKYLACKKKDLYEGDKKISVWNTSCSEFQEDNDIEEQYDDTSNACFNCLYRRWTADGFDCMKNVRRK